MRRDVRSFDIAGRPVGSGAPIFTIAEIGLNHGGSLERALALVDAAADAGADAVKFQTIVAADLVAPACPPPAHVQASSLVDFFAAFELDEAAHLTLAARARSRGLAVMATPFSLDAVSLLERIGIDAYKIASGDLTWDQLIARAAATGKPLVMSTGMASEAETSRALGVARAAGARAVALLHCVSAYPVPRGSENLRAIASLRRAFDVPSGLSDHGDDLFALPIAVTLGASIYERHLVLPGDTGAVDLAVSSTPAQFASAIAAARRTGEALGHGRKECLEAERPNRVPSRRALCAARNLDVGRVLVSSDLVALRPAAGVPPSQLAGVIGLRLTKRVAAGAALQHGDLESTECRRAHAS